MSSGRIIKHSFSEEQAVAILEYEALVNDQAFSLLDDLEQKIEVFRFKLIGEDKEIFDLQIWRLEIISFRIK